MDFNLNNLYQAFIEISSILKYDINSSTEEIYSKCNEILISQISKMNLSGYIFNESIYPVLFLNNSEKNDEYLISFSSLDGIKNLNSNVSIGSIFGIYKFNREKFTLEKLVLSGYCLYGTKTILVVCNGTLSRQFILDNNKKFILINNINISNKNNNLYLINSSRSYESDILHLIKSFKRNNYNQRWFGSMVADCHHILTNGGIFLYPTCTEFPKGKLNYIIQVLPICFTFQSCGGIGINGNFKPILNKDLNYDLHKNTCKNVSDIILCNINEYKNIINILDIEENIKC